MYEAAERLPGTHDFRRFAYQPAPDTQTVRTLTTATLTLCPADTLPFVHQPYWELRVRSAGFLRHQVRLMAGAIMAVGAGKITPADLTQALEGPSDLYFLAPAAGLTLYQVVLQK